MTGDPQDNAKCCYVDFPGISPYQNYPPFNDHTNPWIQPQIPMIQPLITPVYPLNTNIAISNQMLSTWKFPLVVNGDVHVMTLDLPGVESKDLQVYIINSNFTVEYHRFDEGAKKFVTYAIDPRELDIESCEVSFKACVLNVRFKRKKHFAPTVRIDIPVNEEK